MVVVLIMNGKGNGNADTVSYEVFDCGSDREDIENANLYIVDHEQRHSDGIKYWTKCVIADEGESIETYSE